MKIVLETMDGFLIEQATGKSKASRVARLEYQSQPRAKRQIANIIVDEEDAPTILEAAAAYLRGAK